MNIDSPSCLAAVGIGAGEQDAEVGAMGERGPDLLAVDEPAAGHRNGAGLHAGDVGSGAGFGEQLAPDLASGEDARHVAASLRIGAELQQRRQAVPERDGQLLGHQREAAGLLPPRRLVGGGQAVAAEGRRHAQPGQTGGVERALEGERPIQREIAAGVVGRRGRAGGGVDAQEAASALTEPVEVVVHVRLPFSRRCRPA